MVAIVSQEAWVRACLAGQQSQVLPFHPFYRYLSVRAQADCEAAMLFVEQTLLDTHYQAAEADPDGIVAGILAVRCDLLLARQFVGVTSNIGESFKHLSIKQLTLAQVVYMQLWACCHGAESFEFLPDKQALTQQQCEKLIALLDKPAQLALYLNEFDALQTKPFTEQIEIVSEPGQGEQPDIELEESSPDAPKLEQQGAGQHSIDSAIEDQTYQVFNYSFDCQVTAGSLAPHVNYETLKLNIDQQLPEFASLSRRLANKLRRHLLSLQKSAWQDELEEGYLNSARLAAAIASPVEARPFRQLIDQPLPQSAVSLLIDCSGSMKQQPLLMAAAWVDALVGALELCQVKVEVLGFTTGHWNDGPVQQLWKQQWQQQGGEPSPGRLNDLLHIEFKSFEQPWRKVRNGLAAVLEHQWQKENIDGEALSWAYERLKVRTEHKKLLFVLADAKPFDQSTLENNGSQYLEQDLLNRVKEIEQDQQMELMAIGIGHRVCRVYSNSLQISQLGDLPHAMLDTLIKKL